jgi:thioesterase domain-containing protein/acyl carrier protein
VVIYDERILFYVVREACQATLPNGQFEPNLTLADAGIDSLKAMELILRIEQALGCRIPSALLTPETTPRSLALSLSHGGQIKSSVDKPLLFVMNGISGHAVYMVRSWQTVLEELQLVLVDAPGLDRPRALLTDLSATAAEVAAEIARRQPNGDIRVMGYSYGAALAYEVARQMQVQGRRIAFLGLIDLLPVRGAFLGLAHAVCSPALVWRKLAARLPRQAPATQTLLIQAAISLEAHGLASRLARAKADREGLDSATADWLEIHHRRGQALRRWRPAPIDAPALLIASDDGILAGSPHFWRSRITGLKVVHVAGPHDILAAAPANSSAVRQLRAALQLNADTREKAGLEPAELDHL